MKKLVLFFLLICAPCLFANQEDNQILVVDNGLEMFEWDLEFVSFAEQSVEVNACFLGGTIAQRLFAALDVRLSEASQLHAYILTAAILLEKEDWEYIELLRAKYPGRFHFQLNVTVPTLTPDIAGIDNHCKMFIVDETYFSVGGTNLDQSQCTDGSYTPPRNNNKLSTLADSLPAGMRDQDIVGKGSFAQNLRKMFHQQYALWENYDRTGIFEKDVTKFEKNHYFEITQRGCADRFENLSEKRLLSSENMKLIGGGPHQKQNAITLAYVKLIEEAKEEIFIGNLYSCPVEPILDALLAAINRGVKLNFITNGVSEIAPQYTQFFCWANRIHYVPLFYGKTYHFWDAWTMDRQPLLNTRIFEYHLKDVLYHKKMMIIDGKKCVVGSYNLGYRSHMGDYELIVEMDSEEIASDLRRVLERDLMYSREVLPKEACAWYFDPLKVSLGEMQKRFHGLL